MATMSSTAAIMLQQEEHLHCSACRSVQTWLR